ncbi:MAG: hypothetical protein R3244_09750, partial [Thermoanaerobaculia bacterium]|nr:hypothetical protein [Thermoanaerobaculia bacterium]
APANRLEQPRVTRVSDLFSPDDLAAVEAAIGVVGQTASGDWSSGRGYSSGGFSGGGSFGGGGASGSR